MTLRLRRLLVLFCLVGTAAAQQTTATFTSTTTQINLVMTPGSSASQTVIVQCSTNTLNEVTTSESTQSGGNWLSAPPAVLGSGFFMVPVFAIATGLGPGTYSGTVVIGSHFTTATLSIPVVLTVTPPVLMSVSPGALVFNAPAMSNAGLQQTLTISASAPSDAGVLWKAAPSTTSGGNWLLGTANGQTYPPGTPGVGYSMTVGAVAGSLSAGTYTGAITITAPGASNSPLTVPVTLNVTGVPLTLSSFSPSGVVAGAASFTLLVSGSGFVGGSSVLWNGMALPASYNANTGQLSTTVPASLVSTPGNVTVTIQNPGGSVSNALTFTVQKPMLFGVTPMSTTAGGPAFTLSALGFGFESGSNVLWNGSALTSSYDSTSNGSQLSATVPASLIASSGNATLSVINPDGVTSNSLIFTINPAAPVLTSMFPLGVLAASGAFTLTVNGTGFLNGSRVLWNGTPLMTTYASGSQLTATVPAGDAASQGSASVSIQNPSGVTSSALTLVIYPAAPVLTGVSPSSITAGGPPFTLTLSGSGFLSGVSVLWNGTTLATTYVSASQLTAVVPSTLIASAGTADIHVLNPGQVSSNIIAVYINSPGALTIVTPPQLPPGMVGLGYSMSLTAMGGQGPYEGWSVAAGSQLPPGFVLTPGVTTSTAGLNGRPTTAGIFTFTLEVTDGSGAIATEQFSLAITGAIDSNGIANAASYSNEGISPGEIVTIFGTYAGPSKLVGLELNAQGYVSTNLGGLEVLFNGMPAPLIYSMAGQVSCVVPYEVSAGSFAQLQVMYQGQLTVSTQVNVVAAVPGVFTADASGKGQGAILNQDGSVNSANNPAARGSIVSVYATGEGQTKPAGVDGRPDPSPAPLPVAQPVMARVGSSDAMVVYAGGAPGLVAGVFQVNVQIPHGVTPGSAVPIVISVGGTNSQANVTVAVE